MQRDDDTFTFVNPAGFDQTFGILASDWVFNAFPTVRVPNLPVDAQDYNQLRFDKEMNPKKIKAIRLLISKFDTVQYSNPFKWVTQDSDGTFKTFVDFPINLIALDQFQGRLVDIYYDNLVIGGNQWLQYTIRPFSGVTMTFIYDDFRLENLLDANNPRQVIYSKAEVDEYGKLL